MKHTYGSKGAMDRNQEYWREKGEDKPLHKFFLDIHTDKRTKTLIDDPFVRQINGTYQHKLVRQFQLDPDVTAARPAVLIHSWLQQAEYRLVVGPGVGSAADIYMS